ncbi:MAG: YkvA family protein [Microcystaceae cyanobacterium]
MKIPIQSLYGFYRNAIRSTKYRWWIILGTLVYLLSPLDISPDVFPIVGELDDFVLVTLMVTELTQILWEKLQSRSNQASETPNPCPTGETVIDVEATPMS